VLSATYRQQSGTADSEPRITASGPSRQRSDIPGPRSIDPENRLLWRMNARRLGFEEFRDSLLAAAGRLDDRMGGRPADLFASASPAFRRSVYGFVDRQFVPDVMRVFDFANPDLHTPQRSETTVPQQALFGLNHPFVADRARDLAARSVGEASTPDVRVARLYRDALRREPTEAQLRAALAFIQAAERDAAEAGLSAAAAAWSYGYGEPDEESGRLKGFRPLPYFTGSAWQGGPQLPDAALGWVQLTAEGGHPGNDLRHAAVRRWTAPRDGFVSIRSVVTHEPDVGDGVRCRIVSSRHGLLASAAVRHAARPLDLDEIEVRTGDVIDFVTDRATDLNSDQFLWSPEIRMTDTAEAADVWNAGRDFTGPSVAPLDPWAQLAQVLLLSNEFLFVD
ncbi:MAG TPA: DUF1553 domain-containing protein, partial [Planctomycetaceae bacterium]